MLNVTNHQRNTNLKPQWDIISHLSEWLSSINQQPTSIGECEEKREPFCIVDGNADWCRHCGKQYGDPQKIKNGSAFWPSYSTSGNISEGIQNTNSKEHKTPMFTATLFTIAKIWKQPKCPSVDEWIKQIWDICAMEYLLPVKKKKILPFVTVGVDLENIMLSERNQSEKDKYYTISLLSGIYWTNWNNNQNIDRLIDGEQMTATWSGQMNGWKYWGKRTHGQQCDDCWREGGIRELNGSGKNTIKIKSKRKKEIMEED